MKINGQMDEKSLVFVESSVYIGAYAYFTLSYLLIINTIQEYSFQHTTI